MVELVVQEKNRVLILGAFGNESKMITGIFKDILIDGD
jgi:hypothetical protein